MISEETQLWNPCEHFVHQNTSESYAVLILNTSFNLPPQIVLQLWDKASVRITVDGGTDRWMSWLKDQGVDFTSTKPPELITGDMDSLSPQTLDYFVKSRLSRVVKTPNQNETDFTKALKELNTYCSTHDKVDLAYVIADTSGRFDQIIANIHTLHKAQRLIPNIRVIQVASDSFTWLLSPGKHSIQIPNCLREHTEWCALIPFSVPARVTTSGLKWNLSESTMEFGGLVSTSNTYDSSTDVVTVKTDHNIVWSMGTEPLLRPQ